MKILLLNKDDNCLTQMAKGYLKMMDSNAIICTAGLVCGEKINAWAICVMQEKGVDISDYEQHFVDDYVNESWGVAVVIGDDANAFRDKFGDNVRRWVYVDFGDVDSLKGDDAFMLNAFRLLSDNMHKSLRYLYADKIRNAGELCSCGANDFCICH